VGGLFKGRSGDSFRGATERTRRGRARFCEIRVTPAHDWRERRLAPEVWLLCERDRGSEPRTKYFLVHLPSSASLTELVHLAQRWAIEQQYQELKDERRRRGARLLCRGAVA